MVLVDTSVWIDHFRSGHNQLSELLRRGIVVTHPFIIGELACGNLKNRKEIMSLLNALPKANGAINEEVLFFINKNHLFGKGLGLIDMHLLASAIISKISLWTVDARLKAVAAAFKLTYHYD